MRYGLIPQTPEERAALKRAPQARVLLEPFLPLVLARALMALVDLGLAQALEGRSKRADELAAELGLREAGLRRLLRVLVAAGYLCMERQAFGLTPLSRATLLRGAAAPLDAWVRHNSVHWRVIETLERALTHQGPRDLHHHLDGDEAWAAYGRAMLQTARLAAEPVARLMPAPAGRELLLDLGGSHGLYGAAICRRFAPMRSRVLELPEALVHARALGAEEGLLDVVDYAEGDLRRAELGRQTCDVVFMGNVIHHVTDEDLPGLLGRVHAALRPGGVVGIWDMAPPPESPELDLVAEGFSLLFYLSSASACRRPEAVVAALNAAGFGEAEIGRGPSPTHLLIAARRTSR